MSLAKENLEGFLSTENSRTRAARKGKLFDTTPGDVQQEKRDYEQIVLLLEQAGGRDILPGEESLLRAARLGNLDLTLRFIAEGENLDAKDPKNGYTALVWAILKRNDEIAEVLLQNGADANIAGHRGETALLIAARDKAPIETYTLLLSHGADPNCVDESGSSALMLAAPHAPIEGVQLLLDAGADPNLKAGESGYTAANFAVMAMRLDVLELLMAAGAE